MPTDCLAVVAGEAMIDLVPARDGTLAADPGASPPRRAELDPL